MDEADTDSVNSNDSELDGQIEAFKENINTLQMEIREIQKNLSAAKTEQIKLTLVEEKLAAFKTEIGRPEATHDEIKLRLKELVRKEKDVKRLEGLLKKKEELKIKVVGLREKNDRAHMKSIEAPKDLERTKIMSQSLKSLNKSDKHLSSNRQNQRRPAPERRPLKTTVVGTAVLGPSGMCTK